MRYRIEIKKKFALENAIYSGFQTVWCRVGFNVVALKVVYFYVVVFV